ncbi:MAG: acetylornithine deacetylase [Asticcacaulis sp.]
MTVLPSTQTLGLLGDLIGFDTVSAKSNRALIDYVAAYLKGHGIGAEVIASQDGAKASLWATIGPEIDGGIVLSGHSDVVPVDGQDWSSNPFLMDIRDGRAYGRGVTDMKGFVACVLAAAPSLSRLPLKRPVHIALTYDEEVGCIGAPQLLAWLRDKPYKPAIAFIGEPTSMRVVNAHKGIMAAHTEIAGCEAHSSLAHQGVSAIGLAAQAIGILQTLEAERAAAHVDPRFEPSRATVSVNLIGGGTAINILAGQAWFDWDIRSIPAVDAHELRGEFERRLERDVIAPVRAQFAGVDAQTRVWADAPALKPEDDGEAEALAKRILGTNEVFAVPYAAEAGQFQEAGLSTVIVGPGSIEQAHKVDEFIELSQLAACEAFLQGLIVELVA